MQRLALLTLSALALAVPSFAVDGIAVSMKTHTAWQAYWDTTWKYEIRNDQVVSATPLFTGKSRYASINITGTHVAFFNKASNGTVYLSVMPMAGGAVVNLCQASTSTYGCAGGMIDWTLDGWICFTTNNVWSDGDGNLYRVKYPEGGQPEVILHCSKAPLGAGQISADGTRAFFTLGATGVGMSKYTLSGTLSQNNASEVNWCQVNCGAALSPSGTYLLNFDGSHDHYAMQTWGNTGPTCSNDLPKVMASAYNTWCTNCPGAVICDKDYSGDPVEPYTYTVGWGASGDQNRFSVNSDKWFSSDIGTLGRYASCSCNQVLINWVDHKSINVSRNPRSCMGGGNVECHENVPNQWTANEGGDFIVTAPMEDILPALRQFTGVQLGRTAPQLNRGTALSTGSATRTFDLRGCRVTARSTAGVVVMTNGGLQARLVPVALR